jgi:dTDP-4-dehydrorhamnose 3,5-epimerase
MPFRFEPTDIGGVVIAVPKVFTDERGLFLEAYRKSDFVRAGLPDEFVQENHSTSTLGTLRGLHAQREPCAQGKLVTVVDGEIFEVAVDARAGSPTFGRWVGATFSAGDRRSLYVPPGCLHGFCVTSAAARVIYRATSEYAPALEYGVRWDDPDLAIPWPVREPLLSDRDKRWPRFRDLG